MFIMGFLTSGYSKYWDDLNDKATDIYKLRDNKKIKIAKFISVHTRLKKFKRKHAINTTKIDRFLTNYHDLNDNEFVILHKMILENKKNIEEISDAIEDEIVINNEIKEINGEITELIKST